MAAQPNIPNYRLGAVLGRGQFGTVRLAEDTRSGQWVAVKLIPKGVMEAGRLEQEIGNHVRLNHTNILEVIELTETSDFDVLVLEHAEGGDLFDYIVRRVRVPEDEARAIFMQLLDAVAYCHQHGVAHRDLKPENILFGRDSHVKLADFGLSAQMADGVPLTESVGSPNYAAPELLTRGCAYDGRKVDVWSCGVILYVLLAGCLPFDADEIPDLFKLIRRGQYAIPGYFSREAADLVGRMLSVDPSQRISVAEIHQHPWLSHGSLAEHAEAATQVGPLRSQGDEAATLLNGPIGDLSAKLLTPAMKVHAATCSARLLESGRRVRCGLRQPEKQRVLSAQILVAPRKPAGWRTLSYTSSSS